MNKADQKRIVDEILGALKSTLAKGLENVPENWDGHELRHWVAVVTKREFAYPPLDSRRKRSFNNDLAVHNL